MRTTLNPRNVAAQFHRPAIDSTSPYMIRRYVRLSTAMPRAMALLIEQGQPLDVVEFFHADTGVFLGFLRLHTGGRVSGSFLKG